MRIVNLFVFLLIITISSSGCKSTDINNSADRQLTFSTNNLQAISTISPALPTSTMSSINDSSKSATNNKHDQVIIKSYYNKPSSLEDRNTILMNGINKGEEYIEVTIKGEISSFEQVLLTWNENKNATEEKQIVKTIDKLENQILVIKTHQPEGIPMEKIKWKSRTGKTYEYIIHERSLGDIDNSISTFDLN